MNNIKRGAKMTDAIDAIEKRHSTRYFDQGK